MICSKCGTMVPDGRSNCTNCGTMVKNSSDYNFDHAEKNESYEYAKKKGFLQSKSAVMLLGSIEIIIGIITAFSITVEIGASFPDAAIVAGLAIGIWAVLLPIIGLILVGMGQNKLGGGMLVAGSIICIPIGFVGVLAGITAFKLDD